MTLKTVILASNRAASDRTKGRIRWLCSEKSNGKSRCVMDGIGSRGESARVDGFGAPSIFESLRGFAQAMLDAAEGSPERHLAPASRGRFAAVRASPSQSNRPLATETEEHAHHDHRHDVRGEIGIHHHGQACDQLREAGLLFAVDKQDESDSARNQGQKKPEGIETHLRYDSRQGADD